MQAFNAYALQTIVAAEGENRIMPTVNELYGQSLGSFSARIGRVSLVAEAAMADLDSLEERLFTIHALCSDEALSTQLTLDSLLWDIWTIIGSNKAQVQDLRHRMIVLRDVQQYRCLALAHVVATMHILTGLDADLLELREALAAGTNAELPIEVHVRSIDSTLRRLTSERALPVPNRIDG